MESNSPSLHQTQGGSVERRLLRRVDAGLVYTTRVVGQAPAEVAAALAWRTPSLVRRRHRVEQVLAADALGHTKPRGCYVAAACPLMGPNSPANDNWLAGVALVALAALLAVAWIGAELAALLGGHHLAAGLGPTFHALLRLPANANDPRLAWGPPWQSVLPGHVLYWACTALAAALAAVAIAMGLRLLGGGRVGTGRRTRLGVDTQARLATARDLRPLVVKGPTRGRLILGRVQGRLVATELRNPNARGRRDPRAGDRSAVAVFRKAEPATVSLAGHGRRRGSSSQYDAIRDDNKSLP